MLKQLFVALINLSFSNSGKYGFVFMSESMNGKVGNLFAVSMSNTKRFFMVVFVANIDSSMYNVSQAYPHKYLYNILYLFIMALCVHNICKLLTTKWQYSLEVKSTFNK